MAIRFGPLALCLLPSASADPLSELHAARGSFADFKTKFSRSYRDEGEEERRFEVFQAKLKWINEENSKGHSSMMVVNNFSDLTKEEFLATYANLKHATAEDAWGSENFLGYASADDGRTYLGDVDWVSRGAVTPVKNQGSCGSCWSFSVTGVIEGRYQIAKGTLVSLSEQQFVDCDGSDDGCDGGYPPGALGWAKNQAICTEQSYPYTATDGSCRASSCSVGVARGQIIGYKQLPKGSASAMVSALNDGPVSVAVDANDPFGSYGGGILTNRCGTGLNHAILAVGYTSTYWKVKNSWGTGWGEGGYIRLTRQGDECGVLDQASYPVIAGGPGPSPTPPGPSPGPSPTPPGPSPCNTCQWNSDCPSGQDCYYPTANADSGCCSAGPPSNTNGVVVV